MPDKKSELYPGIDGPPTLAITDKKGVRHTYPVLACPLVIHIDQPMQFNDPPYDAAAVFAVDLAGNKETYRVAMLADNGAWRCQCPSFMFCPSAPRFCKHTRAVSEQKDALLAIGLGGGLPGGMTDEQPDEDYHADPRFDDIPF